KDPGCHGVTFKEKNIALAVSLKLGHFLEDNDKNVKVVYTRTTDVFVPLNDRAQIANTNHADLFICIHLNASPNHEANGSATYVMNPKKSEGNLEIEKQENSAILFEKDYKTTYSGYDPNSPTGNILLSMYQNLYLQQSLDLASKIQDEYAQVEKRKNNSVKQAGFLVLWKTAMPSLLTEIGFLTNPDEEKFMGGQKGEDEIAKSIFLAFEQYKAEKENTTYDPKSFTFKEFIVNSTDTLKADTTQIPVINKDSIKHTQIKKAVVKDSTIKKDHPKITKHIVKDTVQHHKPDTNSTPVKHTDDVKDTAKKYTWHPWDKHPDSNSAKVNRMKDAVKALKVDSVPPKKKKDSVVKVNVVIDSSHKYDVPVDEMAVTEQKRKAREKKTNDSLAAIKANTHKTEVHADTGKTCLKVQFILSDHALAKDDRRFENLTDVDFYVDNKIYKYTAGCFTELKDAVDLQKKLRDKGYKDAFVVAFKGKKRITVKEVTGK
ncbi:MAG TPA: N-acetylmuramoyl-L-alanine amidase, partial [Bacteroidia bacterium]|nr:N-acetylmuramoyl-L-alanine amidase [Bacteroidia bacterium]